MKIITYPNSILDQKTEKIRTPLSSDIQKLVIEMRETMRKNNGLGLAAPQVGKPIRLCIVEYAKQFYVFINPKITAYSKEKNIAEEGCLSFPEKFLSIERFDKIKVRYLNEKGEHCKLKVNGLIARALQHEIDHLNGIVFINRQ